MPIEDDRLIYLNSWRAARNEDNFMGCEYCARDLLTTLDENSKDRNFLEAYYNTKLAAANKEIEKINEAQKHERVLRRLQYGALYLEVARAFWIDLYDTFFQRFMKAGLIPKEK